MSSRIGKKTYTSPEYAARQLAYAKLPLLKVEHPLRHIASKCYESVRSVVPRSADVAAIELAHSAFKRMMRYPVRLAKLGQGAALQRIVLRQA